MWTQTLHAPSAERLGGDRIVEVARAGRVDREGRQLAQVAPLAGRSRRRARRLARLRSSRRTNVPAQAAVEHQRLDHVAGARRGGRSARSTRAPEPRPRRLDEDDVARPRAAPPPRARGPDHDAGRGPPPAAAARAVLAPRTAARPSGSARAARAPPRACPAARRALAWSRSPRAGARRSPDLGSERFQRHLQPVGPVDAALDEHFGLDPGPLLDPAAAEVAPVGREVLADRDVERAAVGERLLLLEDALAEGVACRRRSRGGGPAARRSRSPRPRRCWRPRARPPGSSGDRAAGRHQRLRGCVRPRVVTIVPFGMKMLAISCASSTSPPPLPRRSSTIPRAPALAARVRRPRALRRARPG